MPTCPVPGSNHGTIPEGENLVYTLVNVVTHLAEKDTEYLAARCQQLLADLGVVDAVSAENVDVTDSASGGGTQ